MDRKEQAPRLLAVMSHPDDAEILIGGTLFHLKDVGWDLGIVTMTRGDCGSATHSKEEISRIRHLEAKTAADYLGAWYGCVGLSDVEIFVNAENLRRIVEFVRAFDPEVVITHSPADYMLDHEETSRLARAATFAVAMPLYETGQAAPAAIVKSTPALYYADSVEGTDSMGKRVWPQFYIDVTPQLERKRRMLSCHESQRDWLRDHHGIDEYLDRMTSWAARFGRECGFAFAEGLRQHLGHGYQHEPLLQIALGSYVHIREA